MKLYTEELNKNCFLILKSKVFVEKSDLYNRNISDKHRQYMGTIQMTTFYFPTSRNYSVLWLANVNLG